MALLYRLLHGPGIGDNDIPQVGREVRWRYEILTFFEGESQDVCWGVCVSKLSVEFLDSLVVRDDQCHVGFSCYPLVLQCNLRHLPQPLHIQLRGKGGSDLDVHFWSDVIHWALRFRPGVSVVAGARADAGAHVGAGTQTGVPLLMGTQTGVPLLMGTHTGVPLLVGTHIGVPLLVGTHTGVLLLMGTHTGVLLLMGTHTGVPLLMGVRTPVFLGK